VVIAEQLEQLVAVRELPEASLKGVPARLESLVPGPAVQPQLAEALQEQLGRGLELGLVEQPSQELRATRVL
jgi:hypothetical protein